MSRGHSSFPLENPDENLLVLDANGSYGDGAEWTLRDSQNHILRALSVKEAIALFPQDAAWIIETTRIAADLMEHDARAQAERLGGMDDNVRDLWQSAISLRAEIGVFEVSALDQT